MEYFIAGLLIVILVIAAVALLFVNIEYWGEPKGWFLLVVNIVFWSAIIGFMIKDISKESEKDPCLEYETTMMYNPTAKMMMPVRSCVKRGEWVDE